MITSGSLARWGLAAMSSTDLTEMSVSSLAVLLHSSFDRPAACGFTATCELRVDGAVFAVVFDAEGVRTDLGPAAAPDIVISTSVAAVAALLVDGADPIALEKDRQLHVLGSPDTFWRMVEVFQTPRTV